MSLRPNSSASQGLSFLPLHKALVQSSRINRSWGLVPRVPGNGCLWETSPDFMTCHTQNNTVCHTQNRRKCAFALTQDSPVTVSKINSVTYSGPLPTESSPWRKAYLEFNFCSSFRSNWSAQRSENFLQILIANSDDIFLNYTWVALILKANECQQFISLKKKNLFFKNQINLNREASCNLSTHPQKPQNHLNTRRVWELRRPQRA